MKFTADRDALAAAVAAPVRAATGRPAPYKMLVPALQLTANADGVVATGLGSDLVTTSTAYGAVEETGQTYVPARLFADIVRSFDSGSVLVESVASDAIAVKSGSASFTIRTVAEESQRQEHFDKYVSLNAGPLAEGIRQVILAASKDDSRAPVLAGVLFDPSTDGVTLVATDSYRLAIKQLIGYSNFNGGQSMVLPQFVISEVSRLLADDDLPVEFACNDTHAQFVVGNTTITGGLIRGAFPDYTALVPRVEASATFTTNREALIHTLKRLRVILRSSKGDTSPVRITFGENRAELEIRTAESGNAVEVVDGSSTGELVIAFNPDYLLDGAEAITTDDVVISMIDQNRPGVMSGVGDDTYKYLLMPVRVS